MLLEDTMTNRLQIYLWCYLNIDLYLTTATYSCYIPFLIFAFLHFYINNFFVSTGNFQSYVTLLSQTIALQFSLKLILLYNLHCAGHTIIVIFYKHWYLKLSPKSQLHLISIIQRWFENNSRLQKCNITSQNKQNH